MRYPKSLLIAATSILFVGGGAVAMAASTDSMTPISTTITEFMTSIPHAIHDAFVGDTTPVKNDSATNVGGTQGTVVVTAEKQQQALATVRTLMTSPSLTLSYVTSTANPYNERGPRIDAYVDTQNNEYWIDTDSNRLVQMGPAASTDKTTQPYRSKTRQSVSTLREKALAVAAQQMPSFATVRSSFHPLEENKEKEVYFFRWDDTATPTAESEMPPFLQVGLFADGTLASFTNTLTR